MSATVLSMAPGNTMYNVLTLQRKVYFVYINNMTPYAFDGFK